MPKATMRLPVYVQIAELLIREIGAGRLVPGARLAPERQMAKELDVSVGTLRKALKELEKHGMLERVQGSGNYVRANRKVAGVYSMFRLELPEGGGLPRADVLAVDHLRKPADLPEFGVTDSASRVRRLRYLNEVPVAVEEIWLDSMAGEIIEAEMSESLYRTYQERLGFWIERVEDRVSVAARPDWAPGSFAAGSGQAMGYVERFGWGHWPEAVEFSRTWFDPDRARYVQRL